MTNVLTTARGSDDDFLVRYRTSAGVGVPIVGVNILDPDLALNGRLEIVENDFSIGEFFLRVEGTSPISVGKHQFWLQVTYPSGVTRGIGRFILNVQ